MTDHATGPRVYGEADVRRILERAAVLQSEGPSPGDSRAMTLAEIEQAAAEAGLDRALVRRAAAEITTPAIPGRPTAHNRFLGAPTRLLVEALVPGTIDPSQHSALVGIIQDVMGNMGNVQSLGESLAWSPQTTAPTTAGRQLMVTVRNEDGLVRVRAEENLSVLASGFFGGLLGGLGGGGLGALAPLAVYLATTVSVVTAPILIGGWLGGVYALSRRLYRKKVHARRRELEAMVEALADHCSRPALPERT